MNILFLVYHGFSNHSGVSKKILYQINALRSLGNNLFVCTYDVLDDGRRVRRINNDIIENYGKGNIAALKSSLYYDSLFNFILKNKIDFVYSRSYHNANPFTINLFRRLKSHNIKTVIEIPTYPYDSEYDGLNFKNHVKLTIDKIFRKSLAKETNAIVTFTNDDKIFGTPTICISNGIDFDNISLKKGNNSSSNELHLIGVAEVHYWHGFDRLIKGLGEYYANGGQKDIYFHIVGGVADTEMYGSKQAKGFSNLAKEYRIEDRIIYHGQLFGEELDKIFDECDFAIGSLARHRCGITNIKTLKNREYAARGIPFIYSETDDDFDNMPYILKAKAEESAVNIQSIIDFHDKTNISAIEIRNSIKHLSWKEQMKKVIYSVYK